MLRYMHSYLTLLMTKYYATDSNNLQCQALLAALYFPLESTSHSVLLLTHFSVMDPAFLTVPNI